MSVDVCILVVHRGTTHKIIQFGIMHATIDQKHSKKLALSTFRPNHIVVMKLTIISSWLAMW